MQFKENQSINQLFARMHRQVNFLLSEIPVLSQSENIKTLLSENDTCAFNLLRKLPARHLEIDGKPLIICVLVGPSGSGKSTIFNLLTGLKTPAGGAVRPMTFSSTVAIPQAIYPNFDGNMVFPGFELVELTSNSDLRNRNIPAGRIFKAPYHPPQSDFWLCLVDIPDFNTTETTNWNKAEQMIERADSVIYTVFTESYKDKKAYDFLKKCCRFSGSLCYLLTKLDADNPGQSAQAVREDLLNFAGEDPDFRENRANDLSLIDYLQTAPFYYSARNPEVALNSFVPLANANMDFADFLFGQKGLEIILTHYLQSISVGIKSCLQICNLAESRNLFLQGKLNRIEKHLQIAATRIVGEEFPVFHILAMIRRLLAENRPNLLQRILRPIALLGSALKDVAGSIHRSIRSLKQEEIRSEFTERNQLERSRLKVQSEKLIDKWREVFADMNLDAQTCRKHLDDLLAAELPPVDDEWELFVRARLTTWIANHQDRWIWINVINDLCIFVGAGLFVADVFIDGGMGTLGLVAAIGSGTAAGGLLMSLFNNMGLAREINEAHHLWKQLREKAYLNFFRQKLAQPLFGQQLLKEYENLSIERIDCCRKACSELEEISNQHELT